MRILFLVIILTTSLLTFNAVYAALGAPGAPIVSRNVHVIPKASPGQCPSSWEGKSAPIGETDISRFGSGPVDSPGVLSCTGCAIDNQSGDCVCSTCYDYFND